MALIACSECGREFSDKAAACPACGNPSAASQRESSANHLNGTKPTPRKHSAAQWLASWVASVLIIVLAFALNPTEFAHRAKIAEAIEAKHPILAVFGASKIATLDIRYRSFGIMSVTTQNSRRVSLGVYGFVYVFGP
jgi:hypothetical protein